MVELQNKTIYTSVEMVAVVMLDLAMKEGATVNHIFLLNEGVFNQIVSTGNPKDELFGMHPYGLL